MYTDFWTAALRGARWICVCVCVLCLYVIKPPLVTKRILVIVQNQTSTSKSSIRTSFTPLTPYLYDFLPLARLSCCMLCYTKIRVSFRQAKMSLENSVRPMKAGPNKKFCSICPRTLLCICRV